MAIYSIVPVSEEPEEDICQWSIREVSFRGELETTRHVVGFIARRQSGRASSAIQQFDPHTMMIITRSGRTYHLIGAPGYNVDAEYVWRHWCQLNQVSAETNVSELYYGK